MTEEDAGVEIFEDVEATEEMVPFTVGELIEELSALDPDILVVMSKDPDGTIFSPMMEIGTARYLDNGSGAGHLAEDEDSEDTAVDGDIRSGIPCVVLWPGV